MKPRIVRREVPEGSELPLDWPAVVRRVLGARGAVREGHIETSLKGMLSMAALDGIDTAVELIEEVLNREGTIVIVGDFDADGATSVALAIRALRAMGATRVDYLVPNRFEFGYGLTPEIVDVAAAEKPDLVITVDNGISSHDGIARAHEHHIKVLVTDHHLPGPELPAADAIVNPNLPTDTFESKSLAGVGVVFYVMTALRARLRERGWFERRQIPEPRLADFLDLVALGTVADVVPLDQNNRRLVAQGLSRIRAGRCQPGITALVQAAGREQRSLTTSDLGFAIGPRLNAAGRLSDMSLGIECLLTDDAKQSALMAEKLDQLNRERREIESEMREHAFELVEAMLPDSKPESVPAALVLHHDEWHQGVIGIVASRVKERFHRPVIAFAPGDEATLKGSARSIEGLHVRDVLERVHGLNPGLIRHFGGHAMAAGLSLDPDKLEAFRVAFIAAVDEALDDSNRARVLWSDGELRGREMNLDTARLLAEIAPWGQGFPEPRFDGVFTIEDLRTVGEYHVRLVLGLDGSDRTVAAIAFNAVNEPWSKGDTIHALYKLDINNYRDVETLQLVIDHAARVDD
ncbi:MAG: single-stranded-DNA-specific exonuclease RecJ [Gammaproteobacteria bacterium]